MTVAGLSGSGVLRQQSGHGGHDAEPDPITQQVIAALTRVPLAVLAQGGADGVEVQGQVYTAG